MEIQNSSILPVQQQVFDEIHSDVGTSNKFKRNLLWEGDSLMF